MQATISRGPATTSATQREFETLMRPLHRSAYNLAYRMSGNAGEAEELVQEACVRAWRRFDQYDRARSFRAWLFRILTNLAIDHRRRCNLVRMVPLDSVMPGGEATPQLANALAESAHDPETIALGRMTDPRLTAAIDRLPDGFRSAMLLFAVDQLSYQEIAETLGCAVGTVRSRIHRARQLLRHDLEVAGFEMPDGGPVDGWPSGVTLAQAAKDARAAGPAAMVA